MELIQNYDRFFYSDFLNPVLTNPIYYAYGSYSNHHIQKKNVKQIKRKKTWKKKAKR